MGDEVPNSGIPPGEKDDRAGDGMEGSGVWRRPQAPNGIGDERSPKNVGDLRNLRLAADVSAAGASFGDGCNEATRWKEQYWRAERELRDKSDECSLLKSEVKRLSGRATAKEETVSETPNAQQRIAELEQEVAKQKKETQKETKTGLYFTSFIFVIMLMSWIAHTGHLFNEDEVKTKIVEVVSAQPITTFEALANDNSLAGFLPEWWGGVDSGVISVKRGNAERWFRLNKSDYEDLVTFVRKDLSLDIMAFYVLQNRKVEAAKSSALPTSVPISATPADGGAENGSAAPPNVPVTDDAEWKKAAEGPYATIDDIRPVYDYTIIGCRDDIGVAKVVRDSDTRYLRLRPLLYIALKLHQQERRDNNERVYTAISHITDVDWVTRHRQLLSNERFFAMAAQLPVLTGKEIYGIPHPNYIIGYDDATRVIHIVDGTSFDERFIRVDERWYEMFKTKAAEQYSVLGICNVFADKYGYDAAHSAEPYVAPKPVDPVEEAKKTLDAANKALAEANETMKKANAKAEELEKKTKEMNDLLIRAQQKALENQLPPAEKEKSAPAPKKKPKGKRI